MEEKQELPQGWTLTNVGQVLTVKNGYAFQSTAYQATGVPLVRQADLGIGRIDLSNAKYLPPHFEEEYAKFLVTKGDLLFGMSGSLGKISVYEESTPALQNQRVGLLQFRYDEIKPYIRYYFEEVQQYLSGMAKGVAVQNISASQIESLELPLPPLPEQRRIVAKLEELFSRLDAGVAAVRRAQALLKRYRQSVLHAAVTGELTRAWREAHPAPAETGAALLARIRAERRAQWEAAQVAKRGGQLPLNDGWKSKYVEPEAVDTSGLPELPARWVWGSVEQLSNTVQYGSSAKTREDEDGVPVYRMGNIIDGKLDNSNFKYLPAAHDEFPALLLNAGDLLFNRTNSPELVGKTAVYRGNPAVASFASYLIRVKLNASVSPDLVAYCLNSIYGKNWIKSVVTQQVGQANVNGTKLQAFAIPLPPVEEQAEIVAEVERRLTVLDALGQTLADELKRAERLRQSLLHRAFTGRLVPQDATDEPAAALLARLRAGAAVPAKGRKAQASPAPVKEKKPRGRKPIDITQIDFSFLDE